MSVAATEPDEPAEFPEHWTDADLDTLLPGDRRRWEVLDGSVCMTPRATAFHADALAEIRNALVRTAVPDWWAYIEVEIRFGKPDDRQRIIPDVIVAPKELRTRKATFASPEEVLLVVEVVSPGSLRADRVSKPKDYAKLGIPSYWRVELLGGAPRLVQYHLTEAGYERVRDAVGRFSARQPWPVELDLHALAD